MGDRQLSLLSVVAPMLDEEGSAGEFCARVGTALATLPWELVIVDDGSTDGTPTILAELATADARIKVLTLSRTFGHQAAITAGLDHASGDAVVMIDADLQDPPELITTMVEHWRAGSDVVYATRTDRDGESRFKLRTATGFYRLLSRVSEVPLGHNSGDFRLLDRQALDALLSMRERHRYLRGMAVWVGFTQTAVPYHRDARRHGQTKYPVRKMLRLAFDGLTSFSHVPLQLTTTAGFVVAVLALLMIPVAIGLSVAGVFGPGAAVAIVVALLLGGIQLVAIGIVGEYVGRVYDEVRGRPLYLVRERMNISGSDHDHGV